MAICRFRSLVSLSKCKPLGFQCFPMCRFSSSRIPFLLENVGFIGLGNMGSRMANNLIKAGYRVTVQDINSDVTNRFSQMGVPTVKTPCEVAEVSDVVVTMLPSSAHCSLLDASYNPVPGVMEGVPSSRDYNGGFASKLMAKDLNLAVESAKEAGCKYPLTSQAQEIYRELCLDGHETEDFSCAFRHYYSGWDEPRGQYK